MHTPGPWHVTTYPGDANVPAGCSVGIDDEFGADGGRDYYLATVVHGDPDELQANARLISDAPELLAALRWALDQLGDSLDPDYQDAFDAATALVARHD